MSALFRLDDVANWVAGAQLDQDDAAVACRRVHTDTRSIEPGDLFVALKGERYDANDFLNEAWQRGAAAAICHASADRSTAQGMPCVVVPDTRVALGQLARAWRSRFTLPVIAVAGSNGKTTVTQMLAAILSAFKPDGQALATRGNLNNDIGVPNTLLRLREQHRIAVIELGMNHPGEIAVLADMVQPSVALVNNAQREHLEFMRTVAAVAAENGSVISSLGPQGVVVIPQDDAYTPLWQTLAGTRRIVMFALTGTAAQDTLVCTQARWVGGAWHIHASGMGLELQYRLEIAGRHNIKNSLAAAAAALAAGVPLTAVVQGLQAFVPVKGRSRAVVLSVQGRLVTLVDDTYNANPDSVQAATEVLADLPGPRLLVLADMGEVGEQGPQLHAEAGRYAKTRGIDQLWTLGELGQVAAIAHGEAQHFDTIDKLIDALPRTLPHVCSVLVKGSRFMHMERVVDALIELAGTAPGGQPAAPIAVGASPC